MELYRQGLACGGGNEKSPSKSVNLEGLWWAQMGSNHRPPDYESPLFDILSASKKSGYLSYLQHIQDFMHLHLYN